MIEFFYYKGIVYRDSYTLSKSKSCCDGKFPVCYNLKTTDCPNCLLWKFDLGELQIEERVPLSDIFMVSEKTVFLADEEQY